MSGMVYLLDTNVISELMRPEPSPAVLAWIDGAGVEGLAISAVSRWQIRYGLALLPEGQRRGWSSCTRPRRPSGRRKTTTASRRSRDVSSRDTLPRCHACVGRSRATAPDRPACRSAPAPRRPGSATGVVTGSRSSRHRDSRRRAPRTGVTPPERCHEK
jgi:hypothetical protein